MIETIQPFLQDIATKLLPNGETIYSCIPKRGVKVMSTGYQKTEDEAIEFFYNELVKKGLING